MIPDEDQDHDDHHPMTTTVLGGDNSITPKMNMDEDADEVTRKVAPSMVLPSFQPMMSTTTTSMLATTTGPSSMPMLIPTHRSTPKPSTSTVTVTAAVSAAAAVPVPPFVWELSSVPLLPHFHPVEQTAVFVPHMAATPTVVSARISAILRELAVEAVYDTTKAKIKCTTLEDQIEFRLRLYQGRAPAYRHGIIVELQRRFGTSLAFHAITQAILAAAQGKSSKIKTTTSPSATSTSNLIHQENILPPAPVLVAEEENEDEDSKANDEEGARMTMQQNAESSLAMVSKMLHLPGFDSQYLALQILSSSVDAEKLSSSMARTVATKLLRSFSSSFFDEEEEKETDQEQDEGTAVGRKVFRYIVTKDQGTTENNKTMSPDRKILRNMCLNILATALRATAYGDSPTTLPRPPASLRCVLLDDVRNAPHHPNTAVLAARCLEHILRRHDPEEEQDKDAIIAAFEIARKVGEARNTTLARQVETCMMLLMVRRP